MRVWTRVRYNETGSRTGYCTVVRRNLSSNTDETLKKRDRSVFVDATALLNIVLAKCYIPIKFSAAFIAIRRLDLVTKVTG